MKTLLFGALLAAVSLLPVSAQAEPGTFRAAACPIAVPGMTAVDCGYLTVPERHETPDGPTIQLAVAIVRADPDTARPDPLLYLQGGPGGSGLGSLQFALAIAGKIDRDIILLDQRGTGYSRPYLACVRYMPEGTSVNVTLLYYRLCALAMLEEGIDLGAYNSAQGAQDIEMLAQSLGYAQLNVYGVSYGTRVALTLMRDRPEIVRTAILDAPYPPQINGYEDRVVNAYDAIQALLDACGADETCDDAFPNLRSRFRNWVVSGEWSMFEYESFGEGMNGPQAIDALFSILYNTDAIPYVPQALEALIAGDREALIDLLVGDFGDLDYDYVDTYQLTELGRELAEKEIGLFGGDSWEIVNAFSHDERFRLYHRVLTGADEDTRLEAVRLHMGWDTSEEAEDFVASLTDSEYARLLDNIVTVMAAYWLSPLSADGVLHSVNCAEEIPFNSIDNAEENNLRVPRNVRDWMMQSVEAQILICSGWDIEAAADIETQTVVSDIPTLVLVGEFDPITPPVYAMAAMEGLTQAHLVVVTGGGHGVIDANGCVTDLSAAFLDAPDSVPDTACVDSLALKWVR